MRPDLTQYGEQADILKAAGPEPGRLLDVGAYDGETFSMTRELMLRGWSGVLVEPNPSAFLKLLELYEREPKASLVNAAVGLEWGLVPFWQTEDMLSTTDIEHMELWRRGGYPFHEPYFVPVVPMQYILNGLGPFDLISIDTEGTSHALFDWALAHNPRVLVIEHDKHANWMKTKAYGYRVVHENTLNLVLARK
jgi:FkbM family methyltransferase